jgi:hypothetical protein
MRYHQSDIKSVHIFSALLGTGIMIKSAPKAHKSRAVVQFIYAVASCTAFVVLKLLDHHLATQHPGFKIVSGHFLSKLGDIGQIYFALKFFEVFCAENKSKLNCVFVSKLIPIHSLEMQSP